LAPLGAVLPISALAHNARYNNCTAPYSVQDSKHKMYDFAAASGAGSYANHVARKHSSASIELIAIPELVVWCKKVNVKYNMRNYIKRHCRIWLVLNNKLGANEEIRVYYGPQYKLSDGMHRRL